MIRGFFQKSTTPFLARSQRLLHFSRGAKNTFNKITAGVVASGTTAAVGGAVYYYWNQQNSAASHETVASAASSLLCPANAATLVSPASQPSVFSGTKAHALYLTVHLKPEANLKNVAQSLTRLQQMVDRITPPQGRDEDDEILAGFGLSPNLLNRLRPHAPAKQNFTYQHRVGPLGEMPSTGGEIFVHAKCNEKGKLFELCQEFLGSLPAGSVSRFEDVYGWVYRGGRDLSGFIDGTENAADEDDRRGIAVEPESGGSYVITQKWLHHLDVIRTEKDGTLESWVGRSRSDSTELSRKAVQSHVARMTGGNAFEQPKVHQIVRQSQPFGSMAGQHGLFFIGYSKTPTALDYMLDRMVGAAPDGQSDNVMRMSSCVTGNFWYFPGAEEVAQLAKVYA